MFIRKNKTFWKVISVFMTVSYLFVVLFSAKFHNHNSEIFKNFSFKKTKTGFYKSVSGVQNSADCLVCHFSETGNSLAVEQFFFRFENHQNEAKYIFSIQGKIQTQVQFRFSLRGPPA